MAAADTPEGREGGKGEGRRGGGGRAWSGRIGSKGWNVRGEMYNKNCEYEEGCEGVREGGEGGSGHHHKSQKWLSHLR